MLIPITCYRCSECNRIYEEAPNKCICERIVFIEGERFGPFVVVSTEDKQKIKVKCILCDSYHMVSYTNVKQQQSCGCKPSHIEIMELSSELITYKCRRCKKTVTKHLPIVFYCCEDKDDDTEE